MADENQNFPRRIRDLNDTVTRVASAVESVLGQLRTLQNSVTQLTDAIETLESSDGVTTTGSTGQQLGAAIRRMSGVFPILVTHTDNAASIAIDQEAVRRLLSLPVFKGFVASPLPAQGEFASKACIDRGDSFCRDTVGNPVQWSYKCQEVEKAERGYNGWIVKQGGRNGTAYNGAEYFNRDICSRYGNGILHALNLDQEDPGLPDDEECLGGDYPRGFRMQPAQNGVYDITEVKFLVSTFDDEDPDKLTGTEAITEYWFHTPNGEDGVCDPESEP
jgi:hypothetical protein